MIYLNRRDEELLADLYLIRYLNTNRIVRLFGNYNSTLRRLRQLQDDNWLKVIDYLKGREHVYTVSKKYAISKNLRYNITKTNNLNHWLTCADYYFYMKSNEKILDAECEKEYKFTFNLHKYTFRPDIVMQTTNRWYLVEIDLSNRGFERKINVWEKFYNSYAYKSHFPKYPPIVIVTNNTDKVKTIIDKNKKINLNYILTNLDEINSWHYHYAK